MSFCIKQADTEDIPEIAEMWHQGWHDGHSAVVPQALTKLRTYDSFAERTAAHLDHCFVLKKDGALVGFHMLLKDEVYQFYIGRDGRGSGAARVLIQDAEARLHASGVKTAWLACAINNDRAGAFYTKSGWVNVGDESMSLETSDGVFDLTCWRFEKQLT